MKPIYQILSGSGGSAILLLIRNLVLAQLMGLENYGIAASFVIVLSAAEMCSNLGLQQLSVQSDLADKRRFQATLHAIQITRCGLATIVVLWAAPYLATAFQVPDLSASYRLLALAPLVGMFMHLDAYRMQKNMEFAPLMWVQIFPALVSLATVLAVSPFVSDFRLALAGLLSSSVLGVLMSHLVARQKYRARFHPRLAWPALKMGWPFALNGTLLFCVFHAEKILVGRYLDLSTLAILSMGFTLTLLPSLVVARSIQSYFLPYLSASNRPIGDFARAATRTIDLASLLSLALCLGVIAFSHIVISILGEKFSDLIPLVGMLAALHAIRVIRAGLGVVAIARGATGNAALSNLPRVMALPLVAVSLANGGGLSDVLAIAFTSEIVGTAISVAALHIKAKIPTGAFFLPIGTACLGLTALYLGVHIVYGAALVVLLVRSRKTLMGRGWLKTAMRA